MKTNGDTINGNSLFRSRVKSYLNNDIKELFFDVILFFKNEFYWNMTSAYTQENKPKFKFTTKEYLSSKPSVAIIPYKDSIQLRLAFNNNLKAKKQLNSLGFEDNIYKSKHGVDTLCLIMQIKKTSELYKLKGLKVDEYFSPKGFASTVESSDAEVNNLDVFLICIIK